MFSQDGLRTPNPSLIHTMTFQNGTLPNPIDIVLVWAQAVFPLDYILYSSMILFLVLCSVSGVKDLGIRFLWLTVYKIKAHYTKPQALVSPVPVRIEPLCDFLVDQLLLALSVFFKASLRLYNLISYIHFFDREPTLNTC